MRPAVGRGGPVGVPPAGKEVPSASRRWERHITPEFDLWFANHKKDGLFGFGNQNNHDFYGFKTNNNMANITDIRKYKKVTRYKNVV